MDPTDRTPETYEILMAEVKILRKLDSDYDQKISVLSQEKDEAEERNLKSRNKLLEIEYVPINLYRKFKR